MFGNRLVRTGRSSFGAAARAIAVALAIPTTLTASATGCGAAQAAAARDPRRCENDPNCQHKNKANDCWAQCVDDPACVDRCRQINQGTGAADR